MGRSGRSDTAGLSDDGTRWFDATATRLFGVAILVLALGIANAGCSNPEPTAAADGARAAVTAMADVEATRAEAEPEPTAEPTETAWIARDTTDAGAPQTEPSAEAAESAEDPENGDATAPKTEPETDGVDRSITYTHIDGLDLDFKNALIDLTAAGETFTDVGGDGDIPDRFDALLASIDHPLTFDDVSPRVRAALPTDLGDSIDIFVLLASQWGLIGCEAHLAGQDFQDWNDNLFGYLLAQAEDLPIDQRNNQAGMMVNGANAATSHICPRLQSHL